MIICLDLFLKMSTLFKPTPHLINIFYSKMVQNVKAYSIQDTNISYICIAVYQTTRIKGLHRFYSF